jgi:tRNA threonylcarbamoyladenosine biosynthesis protein TsaE
LPPNLPSTVINLSGNQLEVLRPGEFNPQFVSQIITNNEQETQKTAADFLRSVLKLAFHQPLVFILQGDLGSGKTVFTKGLGNYLQTETIISPTYVIFYEYQTNNQPIKKLYHFDLYRIENQTDLDNLQIEQYQKPGNLLVFEWGEKIGPKSNLFKNKKTALYLLNFRALGEQEREIKIYKLN